MVSRAGSFYLFGPGERPGDVVILLGVEADDLGDFHCGSLQTATRVRNPWAVEEEQDVPVLLCRDPNMTMQEVWARHGPEWG